MRDMFASGPIHDLAARIVDRLVAPARCSVVVVTLPERLVLSETVELCRALDLEVKLPPARLVVNRFPSELASEAWDQTRALIARGGPEADAAKELLRVMDARRAAREETLEILAELDPSRKKGAHAISTLLFPESLEDLSALDVASWLEARGAA
jgi:hypothetical protein